MGMGATHTNCDPAVLMVVEPKHVARRVGGSPRKPSIESQVRRRRALETAWLTPTSPLDGPMEPAPTEPVGASDTTAEGAPLVSCHRMLEPGSPCHFFSSFSLFGQSDFQVSKTIFDSREILFLELLLGSSMWWRELGETPSATVLKRQQQGTMGAIFGNDSPSRFLVSYFPSTFVNRASQPTNSEPKNTTDPSTVDWFC